MVFYLGKPGIVSVLIIRRPTQTTDRSAQILDDWKWFEVTEKKLYSNRVSTRIQPEPEVNYCWIKLMKTVFVFLWRNCKTLQQQTLPRSMHWLFRSYSGRKTDATNTTIISLTGDKYEKAGVCTMNYTNVIFNIFY